MNEGEKKKISHGMNEKFLKPHNPADVENSIDLRYQG
jgi:hypothetical protein